MIWFFWFLTVAYALFLLTGLVTWSRKDRWAEVDSETETVTVIVPFRNEQSQLAALVAHLQNQTYQRFGVIFINDHSTDNSVEVLEKALLNVGFEHQLVHLKEATGKKAAIAAGAMAADGGLILTTDADCEFGQDWITEMVKPFQEPTIQMVAGPVALTGKRLFQRWQKMEFATLQAIGAILIRKGHPSMANGANLAYRKSAFEAVAGFEGIDQTPSGDDELLLMKVQNAFPGSITFRKAAGAMVTTAALERWQDFKNQRLRWASKWQVGRRRSAMSVALFVFVLNLSWFLLPLLAFAGLVSSDDVLGIWRLRFVIEALWVMWLTRFFVSALSIRAFYLHQFLYPVYVIYFGLMANFGNYHWKGRSYKVRWQ